MVLSYNLVISKTMETFSECNINSFPFNCFHLLQHYGFRIFTYNEAKENNERLFLLCKKYSDDAFRYGKNKTVVYNPEMPQTRISFSLMHELGHEILGHVGTSPKNEMEANIFASYILAPRIAIHYAKCKNAYDVSRAFEISYEAAKIAFEDYLRWRHYIVLRNNKITPVDKAMYDHFYSEDYNKFVWSIKKCKHCGREFINSADDACEYCNIELWGLSEPMDWPCESAPVEPKVSNWWEPPGFDDAERQWLYGSDL